MNLKRRILALSLVGSLSLTGTSFASSFDIFDDNSVKQLLIEQNKKDIVIEEEVPIVESENWEKIDWERLSKNKDFAERLGKGDLRFEDYNEYQQALMMQNDLRRRTSMKSEAQMKEQARRKAAEQGDVWEDLAFKMFPIELENYGSKSAGQRRVNFIQKLDPTHLDQLMVLVIDDEGNTIPYKNSIHVYEDEVDDTMGDMVEDSFHLNEVRSYLLSEPETELKPNKHYIYMVGPASKDGILKSVYVKIFYIENKQDSNLDNLMHFRGLLIDKEKGIIVGNELDEIEDHPVSISVPAEVEGVKIRAVHDSAFLGCKNIDKIHFGKYMQHIGDKAFAGCKNLRGVNVYPDKDKNGGLRTIGDHAFSDTGKLKSFSLVLGYTRSIESIGQYAFYKAGLTDSLDLRDNLHHLGEYAFADNELDFVFFDESPLTIIPRGCFESNMLAAILEDTLKNVEYVGEDAFANQKYNKDLCNDEPKSVFGIIKGQEEKGVQEVRWNMDFTKMRRIGKNAFKGFHCKYIDLKVGKNIEFIGDSAFEGSSLRTFAFEDDSAPIQVLRNNVFKDTYLDQLRLPDNVKFIGEGALAGTPRLKNISIKGSTKVHNNAFSESSNKTLELR